LAERLTVVKMVVEL